MWVLGLGCGRKVVYDKSKSVAFGTSPLRLGLDLRPGAPNTVNTESPKPFIPKP